MLLIDVFFAFFNSALLLALFWFLFRQKLAPGIAYEMHVDKEAREQLSDERVRLAHSLTLIDRDREFRDEQYRNLMEKVAVWVSFEEDTAKERLDDALLCRQRYCDRLQKQLGYVQVRRLEREIIPGAAQASEERLKEHFASVAGAGEVFIERAMHSLVGDSHVQ